ncbi:hypothetical protein LMG28727_06268 [Paraburkholderia kirstenboschensis]|nr:hypothetical protein LMG28727_06268 [Paraburkholderia kirstenboschensis]
MGTFVFGEMFRVLEQMAQLLATILVPLHLHCTYKIPFGRPDTAHLHYPVL